MLPPPPFAVGDRTQGAIVGTTKTLHASDLGKLFGQNGKEYILAQASAAVAVPASLAFVHVPTANVPTGIVALGTVNNDAYAVGVADPAQQALLINDFFLLQVSGPVKYISDAAIADKAPIGIGAATTGRMTSTTITLAGIMGYAIGAAAGAGTVQNGVLIRRI